MSQTPVSTAEMPVEGAQPAAAPSTPALTSDWESILEDAIREERTPATATPEAEPATAAGTEQPFEEEPPEPVEPTAAAPAVPQSAAEWMRAIDASPGREAQVPAKLRAELRDLREERHQAQLTAQTQQARAEAYNQARQEAVLRNSVAQLDQLQVEDPVSFLEWAKANPQANAQYASYKAQLLQPQAAPQRSEVEILQAIPKNAELITALNARPDLIERVRAAAQNGQYGQLAPDGNWLAGSMQAALYDVAGWLGEERRPKADPAARAVEERRTAMQERGAIPKPPGSGSPAAAQPPPLTNDVTSLLTDGWREDIAERR